VLVTFKVPPPAIGGGRRLNAQEAGEGVLSEEDRAERVRMFASVKSNALANLPADSDATSSSSSSGAPGAPTVGARTAAAAAAAPRAAAAPQQRGRGWRLHRDFEQLPISMVTVTSLEGLEALRSNPAVAAVHPDEVATPKLLQTLPLINQQQVLSEGFGGFNCSVAMMDTGESLW